MISWRAAERALARLGLILPGRRVTRVLASQGRVRPNLWQSPPRYFEDRPVPVTSGELHASVIRVPVPLRAPGNLFAAAGRRPVPARRPNHRLSNPEPR